MIAAVTAGGRVSAELAAELGTPFKALAAVAGVALVDRSIDAAREAGARRVVVIGGPDVRAHCAANVDAVVAEGDDGRENIRRAMAGCDDESLLLLTCDLPFVRGSDINAFLARADGHDVALPLAEAEAYERAFPGAPPHLTTLGRTRVANGSVVYFGPGSAPRALALSQRLFAARKSLVRMAAFLGPVLLARFVVGRLEIEHIEARGRTLLGLDARAIRDSSPALCFDVDTIADYRYACERARSA